GGVGGRWTPLYHEQGREGERRPRGRAGRGLAAAPVRRSRGDAASPLAGVAARAVALERARGQAFVAGGIALVGAAARRLRGAGAGRVAGGRGAGAAGAGDVAAGRPRAHGGVRADAGAVAGRDLARAPRVAAVRAFRRGERLHRVEERVGPGQHRVGDGRWGGEEGTLDVVYAEAGVRAQDDRRHAGGVGRGLAGAEERRQRRVAREPVGGDRRAGRDQLDADVAVGEAG